MPYTFALAGGCFWCLDAIYREMRGVSEVTVGFAGGSVPHPTSEQVATGETGHAEVVRVSFDPAVVPPSVILDIFFAFHDPTQLNRQGDDIGTHYRSALFYEDDEQRALFERALAKAADLWEKPIVTRLERLDTFYPAEESNQAYFAKNPADAYCERITKPKILRLRKSFAQYLVHSVGAG